MILQIPTESIAEFEQKVEAEAFYHTGLDLNSQHNYDEAFGLLDKAAELYDKLVDQTENPEVKRDYLNKYADCLMRLNILKHAVLRTIE